MEFDHPLRERLPDLVPSCAEHICQVRWSDLPLACPMPGTSLWNAHPRVYLAVEDNGRDMCPYCGTVYILPAPQVGEPVPQFTSIHIEKCYWLARQKAEVLAVLRERNALPTPANAK